MGGGMAILTDPSLVFLLRDRSTGHPPWPVPRLCRWDVAAPILMSLQLFGPRSVSVERSLGPLGKFEGRGDDGRFAAAVSGGDGGEGATGEVGMGDGEEEGAKEEDPAPKKKGWFSSLFSRGKPTGEEDVAAGHASATEEGRERGEGGVALEGEKEETVIDVAGTTYTGAATSASGDRDGSKDEGGGDAGGAATTTSGGDGDNADEKKEGDLDGFTMTKEEALADLAKEMELLGGDDRDAERRWEQAERARIARAEAAEAAEAAERLASLR